MNRSLACATLTVLLATILAAPAAGQDPALEAGLRVERLEAEPAELVVEVGGSVALPEVRGLDGNGRVVDDIVLRFVRGSRGINVADGRLEGLQPGDNTLIAVVLMPAGADREPAGIRIPVRVEWPGVERVAVEVEPGRLYVGTALRHVARALHADGSERPGARVRWSSSDPAVASVGPFGVVRAHRPGSVRITAAHGGQETVIRHEVSPFPAERLEIVAGADAGRTGDVLTFEARATDPAGAPVDDLPVTWSFTYLPGDSIRAPGAAGEVHGGRFVAEEPGLYTILANAGPLTATRPVEIEPRAVVREVEMRGQGRVGHVHSSDLWVFEGVDGRDYAISGTWGGDGWAYFWDVTDPAAMVKTDSLQVDARTVNDVKVSPDGRWAALSREGASNRRNGVVVLDLADPAHPRVASIYDEGLTGGVHNMFATDTHLFALSAGDKYVILDMADLRRPRYVSEYDHPGSRIHDVWVHDGIAYSSEWGTGVVVVDVGNGRWGGTIEEPVFVTSFPVPTGATHAAFPYFQRETGRFYLFLGDEILSRDGLAWQGYGDDEPRARGGTGRPSASQGYVHIVDFTDPEHPRYVARYEVDEFGTHNMWVEDDILYQAYYEGGLRMVDVSGELMGDLGAQRREIAVFKPFDPDGYIANAPNVWGAQPHKGHIFFSDFNSGLWAVRLRPKEKPTT